MVTINKETKGIINELKEITGEDENNIISTAIDNFLKKKVVPVVAMMSILGFGVFHHVFYLFNQ